MHPELSEGLGWPTRRVTSGRLADDEPAAHAQQAGAALGDRGWRTERPADDAVIDMAMLWDVSKFGGISERDRDTISKLEVLNSSREEVSPSLRPIQQHEFDAGLLQSHHESGHSPAAPEIAPALTGYRASGRMMGPCMLDMRQEVTRAKKTLLLAASEHGNEAFFCHRHDAGNRISHVSRETLPACCGFRADLR